jgi:hypothetical protein
LAWRIHPLYFNHSLPQGKPVERPGRKASGLTEFSLTEFSPMAAGPPSEAKSKLPHGFALPVYFDAREFMTRCALAILSAVLPMFAHADCGFARSEGTVTVVVGKESKCSSAFRAAFRSDIVASVQAMNDANELSQGTKRRKSFDDRTERSQKLWALQERVFQSSNPAGRYYGQR